MKRWVAAAVGTGAIVAMAGLPALASGDSSDDSSLGRHEDPDDSPRSRHQDPDRSALPPGLTRSHRDEATGHGPPPWARHHAEAGSRHGGWKELSPRRREALMAELARQHADELRIWKECLAAGQNECVRPVPPGHAKRD